MDREQYREHLRGLTDEDLFKESIARIQDYRALFIGSKSREQANDLAAQCWGECEDRRRPQIYHDALREVTRIETKRRQENSGPLPWQTNG